MWTPRPQKPPFEDPPPPGDDELQSYVGSAGVNIQAGPDDGGNGGELVLASGTPTGGGAQLLGGPGVSGTDGGIARIQGGTGHDGAAQPAVGIFEGGFSDGSSGRIELIASEIAFTIESAPQVPASPDAQDVVDALLALGLITQA